MPNIPTQPTADYSETIAIQRQLSDCVNKLNAMAGRVALARHVREYDGDRRKRCLAIAALPLLKAGQSSAAADTEARASSPYGESMKQLGIELVAAEKTLAEWDAIRIQIEVARSLLSMQKASMTNL